MVESLTDNRSDVVISKEIENGFAVFTIVYQFRLLKHTKLM